MKRFMMVVGMIILCCGVLFAQEGFLRVTSVPDGASIEVGGKNIGKTPLLTTLKPGTYTLKATLSGYAINSQEIKIVENEVTIVQITMLKEAQKKEVSVSDIKKVRGTGNLTVITDLENATIYLDGVKISEVPPVTIKDIPAGLHDVILVSGDYADSARVMVQKGKTSVLKHSFAEARDGWKKWSPRVYSEREEQERLAKEKAAEMEQKRQALPAKIVLKLTNPALSDASQQDTSIKLWGESDTVELSFQYRKSGETPWNIKTLSSKKTSEDSFTLEKGSYEVQFVATHYKEPTGVLNILLGSKKEKVREYKESATKYEFKPDTQYTFNILYDGKSDFSYKVEEKALNTPLE
ncbi:MAG TPA: PEGA domain-containing protein [bacterium]|nr:PEGA domain-containing protein [bacterium]HPP29433.1 PEGA domain-containing protein [bacterium]